MGFVFQHYALFKHMNVLDNVTFGLRVRKRATRPGSEEIRRRGLELLDLVQLEDSRSAIPRSCPGASASVLRSRGRLRSNRACCCSTNLRRPRRQGAQGTAAWLRQLHDEIGYTTIFVTHDESEAHELADRVVTMADGRIQTSAGVN